MGRRCS